MESFKVENLSFTYPSRRDKALEDINFKVNQGEFVLICGKSGCGKTTLLRLLKPSLAPYGKAEGTIIFNGKELNSLSEREKTSHIGFVMQNPDNQIVTDKVWHELAFGLESLGYKQAEIRARVSEMASFFGIQNWFYKNTNELSGGQKQLLNLAAVMVSAPSVLILDEPTSQLDPIAANEFLNTLKKINQELGTTIILTEHRMEDAFALADRVIVMGEGKFIADGKPKEISSILKEKNHDMYKALPTPVRVYGEVPNKLLCPLTVREGRVWLEEFSRENTLNNDLIPKDKTKSNAETVIEIKDAWFRYDKNLPDIIKGFNLSVKKGELFCLLGGNGTGKTTALSLVAGLNTPYRGDVELNGKSISKIKNLYNGFIGFLPQSPQSLFVKKTVFLDLMDVLSEKDLTKEEKEQKIHEASVLCRIENLLEIHPYDLSGGEQQRAALCKILLMEPEILLLDEPTKGMDADFKEEFADILMELKTNGVTILMVSHDIEFCAEFADSCALVFDGSIASESAPREFFKGKNFYTTSANRMARGVVPDAILAEDIILACGGNLNEKKKRDITTEFYKVENKIELQEERKQRVNPIRIIIGCIFTLLFVLIQFSFITDTDILCIGKLGLPGVYALQIISVAVLLYCFFPSKETGFIVMETTLKDKKLTKRTLFAMLSILILIPLTIYIGIAFLGDRKYYFISLLIIFETIVPFCMVFESRKPKARELIIISVLCAIAVVGRAAFFTLPQFKPVIALVIIAGITFGGETGFLVGTVTGFVSNFFFGQGPWTPWQMFCFGIIGFISGVLFRKGFLKKTRVSLCIFGFLATLIIYGGIMNPSSVIQMQLKPNLDMMLASYISGAPLDIIHAVSTAFFLWFIAEPMIDKLERVKAKYGLYV
ncbi:MAG: ATP-binding cassette domain-containing protein [Clostridia bacterium]|nr:ATP-binding cassette domain-containing protein [Clostridia bacterium]